MNFYDALQECVEQSKKFECKNNFLGLTYHENILRWFDKESGRIEDIAYISQDMVDDDYTEYDSTVYMDFISACKLSKETGVYIKRKNDCMIDRFKVDDDNFSYAGNRIDNVMIYPTDAMCDDWHVVEETK